jgi:hemerythrin-like domain-containing protein
MALQTLHKRERQFSADLSITPFHRTAIIIDEGSVMTTTTSEATTAERSKSPPRQAGKSSGRTPDAIALLKADHAKVKKMFKEFDKLEDQGEMESLAKTICEELKVHTTIEEEMFYPAAREVLSDEDLLDEAEVEHASAKELITQIERGSPDDDKWSAKVKVLGEYINHHVGEEENEMFPKLRKSELDLKALGKELMARKQELVADADMDK